MGNKAMSISLAKGHRTKEERRIRTAVENQMKGTAADALVKIPAPKYVNKNQRKIFKYLLENLRKTGILTILDKDVLVQCAITLDRMAVIDEDINNDHTKLYDIDLQKLKDMLTKQYLKYCGELCLSPSARAKLGVLATRKAENEAETDPLMKVLAGGNNV